MALLVYLCKQGYKPIVAHVNYNKRPSALRDMLLLNDYCQKQGLILEIYWADPQNVNGNFQKWARDLRYRFFAEIYRLYNCQKLYLAHQEDDVLETFIMQKEKNIIPQYYGIQEHNIIYGMEVYRPFLNYSKALLMAYLKKEGIPYGIDETNFEDHYRRNQIRHREIAFYDQEKRQKILAEIAYLNHQKEASEKALEVFLKDRKTLLYEEFITYPQAEDILRRWLYPNLGKAFLKDLLKTLESSKNMEIPIKDKILAKSYGYIMVYDLPKPYIDTYEAWEEIKKPYYAFSAKGNKLQGLKLLKDDWPLTVRSFKEGDSILMPYGHKKVSRFFIDHKIPLKYRHLWPIVLNAKGEIILVPGLGANVNHYTTTPRFFVVELVH